jgi:4-amino-4-deoxy-L-arabinose transferase-like glycosyltransferase
MTPPPPGEQGESPAQRIAWAVLVVLTLAVGYFGQLGVVGLVGPDEPRYAWIARDMAETGDWVTPRLYGKPWFEKPVLYYWGAAACFRIFGVSEASARLPSAVSALLATLALAWLAWRAYGRECARLVLLFLPASVAMIGFSHAAATDMVFAAMLTLAVVAASVPLGFTSGEDTPVLSSTPWAALAAFGFFLGLATLAKGPAAVILAGGALLVWGLAAGRLREPLRLLHPVAAAAFLATSLPWYVLCARRNPDFFRVFIVEHNFKRYLTPEFQHLQPFWYYLPILLVAFLPWSAVAAWAAPTAAAGWFRRKRTHPLSLLLLAWSAFCVLFFSISKSKLPGYVLPAVPALAVLLARAVERFGQASRRSLRVTLLAAGTLSLGLSLALPALAGLGSRHPPADQALLSACRIAALLLSLPNLMLLFAWPRDPGRGIRPSAAQAAALPVLIAVLLAGRLLPSLFPVDPSGKTLAEELAARGLPSGELMVGEMSRGTRYSLDFYLRRDIPEWRARDARAGFLILPSESCSAVVFPPFGCGPSPLYFERSRRFVYRVEPTGSLDRLEGGREPQ